MFISATADYSSSNRDSEEDVVYRAKNIHCKDNRYIYFITDVPHLIKQLATV